MHDDTSPTDRARGPVSYIWWCAACRRAEPFDRADLKAFEREGWPRCCGRQVLCAAAERRDGELMWARD